MSNRRIIATILVMVPALLAQQQPKPGEQNVYFAKVVVMAQQLRSARIDAPPLPSPLPDPFREPGFIMPETTEDGNDPAPLVGSALLNKLTGELRVTGMVTIGGRRALVINSTPRREGETITVKSGSTTYYLFFKSLGNGTATFTMDGAESTIRFRVN